MKIAVYDLDNTTPSLGDDDFLGQIECTLGEVMDGVCVCACVHGCVHAYAGFALTGNF